MPAATHSRTTAAFFVQAAISFVVSVGAMVLGVIYLPVDIWMRSFLALGLLFVVTATFTLAKCVRDQQEDAYAKEQSRTFRVTS